MCYVFQDQSVNIKVNINKCRKSTNIIILRWSGCFKSIWGFEGDQIVHKLEVLPSCKSTCSPDGTSKHCQGVEFGCVKHQISNHRNNPYSCTCYPVKKHTCKHNTDQFSDCKHHIWILNLIVQISDNTECNDRVFTISCIYSFNRNKRTSIQQHRSSTCSDSVGKPSHVSWVQG